MHKTLKYIPLLVAAVGLTLLTYSGSTFGQPQADLRYTHHSGPLGKFHLRVTDGLIFLDAENADLAAILKEISRQTGIPVLAPQASTPRITIQLNGVPLRLALKRLAQNWAIVLNEDSASHEPAKIIILHDGTAVNDWVSTSHGPISLQTNAAGSSGHRALNQENVPHAVKSNSTTSIPPAHRYKPHELVVRFKRGLQANIISRVLDSVGARVKKRIKPLGYVVLSLPKQASPLEVQERLIETGFIDHAEPNYLIPVAQTPNDPSFSEQWALLNTGQSAGTPGADINALEAWDIETGSPEVVIAVIDTGVYHTHSDLWDNIWHNPGEIPDNGEDDDGNGFVDDVIGWDFVDTTGCASGEDCAAQDNDPMDFHGHGTKVAGIAGAVANNGIGIAGVAWRCKIMAVRAGYEDTSGNGLLEAADAAAAITYAADNGARILNLSWGDTSTSSVVEDAIGYAIDKGAIICAAAGNNISDTPFYPAAMPDYAVVAVQATDSNDDLASFSNYGEWVDVAAPGDGILTTCADSSDYCLTAGTSMATPHVSGLAALLFSHYPGFSNQTIVDLIVQNVVVLDSLAGKSATAGRIDLFASLEASPVNVQALLGKLTPNYGSPCAPAETCEGDMDGDGDVDGTDLALLRLSLFSHPPADTQ